MSGVAGPKAKALVVTSDLSRKHFHKPYEYVMGGGATALLVSRDPRFFEIELGKSSIYTNEVSDLTRPTLIVEQGNSETSLLSYIDAVEQTVSGYVEKLGEKITYDYFKKNIYHMPFGGMTVRASRAALRQFGSYKKAEADALWEQKTKKSITYSRRMGGTYAGSTFIGMLGMIDNSDDVKPGDRFGVFSYGSGCCAEFYSGLSVAGALKPEWIKGMKDKAIIFALANPKAEVDPEEAEKCDNVAVIATGSSAYCNQVNNALVFPGMFRGALDARLTDMTDEVKMALAKALAGVVTRAQLHSEYILPDAFDARAHKAVADAVVTAANKLGLSRRSDRKSSTL